MKKIPVAVSLLLVLTFSCNQDESENAQDARFANYISGFTSGLISKKDNITVRFASSIEIPQSVDAKLISLSPSVDGSIVKYGQSLVFSPKEPLRSGTIYEVSVDLKKLLEVEEGLEQFNFSIQTIPMDYEIQLAGLRTTDIKKPKVMELNGTLTTSDFVSEEEVKKMLDAGGKEVVWKHATATSHAFTVKNITRAQQGYKLKITTAGSSIGVDKKQEESIQIPSVKEFDLTTASVQKAGTPYVSLLFSDPLLPNQDLDGLVNVQGEESPRFVIDGNQIQVYLTKMLSGSRSVTVKQGIKNIFGHPLEAAIMRSLAFDAENPAIRFIGQGSILPSSDGLVLPFEAVNLKKVSVDVIQIFEKNIPQFFQVNQINGGSQLTRTGRKVMSKSIALSDYSSDLANWNRFTLDLASLFNSEKGAIYQVRLSFRPEDSLYPCEEIFQEEGQQTSSEETWSVFDRENFNSYYSYYYYPRGYRWSERDNPCHVSYYHSDRFVSRNLVASDLGLITKIGGDNSLHVYTTNMLTASPVKADIEILDYQLQVLANGTTSADGMATFSPERRPFLVIATANGQKSYLKLDDASSRTLSNFDVSGTRVKNWIKGFIYGERGVWRPGNDIFLSFMLEDKDDRIPADQPVIFELRDPYGNVKDRQVSTSSVKDLYTFPTKTDATDVTGNWRASVKVGNATFSRSIKIETIKPNRLKINLDFGLDRISFDRRALEPRLAVNWLTGIAGNDLKVETSVSYRPINTNFEGLANFEFDLPEKQVSAEKRVIFQGNTDEAGNTSFNYTLPQLKGAGGAVRAVFETKAFEPGGNFSVNTSGINYYPYQSFVGLRLPEGDSWGRLEQNVEHQLDVALVNGRGEALNSGKVRMKIYEVRWRWWWDEADDYSVNYMRSSNENLVSNQLIDIQNGKGIGKFKINEWGRYLMIVEDPVSGHAAGEYFYMSWREGEQSAMGATFLAINSKKEEFEVGDEVELTVPGAAGGQALVSIESGSKVVQQFWTKTTAGENIVRFQATPEMSPNVYAHVTLLQPHEQTSNDLPIRLYGIAPLKITDPKTILQPEIKVASELAPGKEVSIKISEKNRRPMVYTLAVVDEGLLDITNYKTPDAWSYFYSREAIGVKTWDIYDDVLGAYGGRLERVLAIGGDGEASLDDKDKKKPDDRFKPVVQFMGPFYSDGKATTHKFVMPQYIGSVKTMIVAGLDGAYGKAEATTPVIKPLMVLGTLPRVVGPGEKISLPVNVFKHKAYIKSATISVETKGTLKINGGNTAKIDLSDAETALQYFELEVAKTTGIGTVKITAKSGKEEAIHEVTLESRAPNTAQTQVKMITLEKGERFEEDLNTFGMKGTNTAMLEIARVPSMNLENRLQYLIRYPHGCIEQTVSAVFPQLFLDEITELSTPQKVKIEENIKAAITRLKKFQTAGGGLSYWPGQSEANSWGTNYGYHFLIEAEKQGFFVSKELKSGLKKAQELQAKYWNKGPGFNGDDLTQAYRLFTLALSGNASLGNMNRMRNVADLSSQAKWKLGAAYSLIGREQVAAELLNSAGDRPSNYPYWYSYGSSLRDKAILLETYTYLDKKGAGFKVLRELVAALGKDTWYSTQTTAYCLLAISKFLGQAPASSLKAAVEYGGKSEDWSSELPIVRASLNAEQKDQALSVSNETDGTLFITLTTSGTPYPGDEPATSAGLRLSMNYYNQGGEKINVSDIKKGQTFTANLRILNQTNDRVRDLALSQIFPSGWEINNDRLNDTNTFSNSSFDHQDIRDDRVYTYFDLERGGSKSFKISLTATYAGEYYLPGAYAEAMYDASISSKSQGSWIQVK